MAGIRVNVAGVVKTVLGLRVNVGGVVKPVLEAYVNDNGTVKKFWPDVGPPNAPQNFRSTAAGSNDISLAWDAAVANGSPVTGYRIEYGTDGVTFGSTQDVGVVLAANVAGLAATTTYYFRIKANSALGYGPVSDVVTQSTQAAAAPLAPTVVSFTTSGAAATTLNINVTPNPSGAVPTFYDIQVRLTGSTGAWGTAQAIAYTGASPQLCVKTGLTSNTSYEAQVRARNAAGSSAYVLAGNSGLTIPSGSNGSRTSLTAEDPEDVGAYKDTGYGTNSAAEGGGGQVFGTLSGSIGSKVTERIARSGNTTFTLWVGGSPVSTYVKSITMYPGTAKNSSRARTLYAANATFNGASGATGTMGIWNWTTYNGDLGPGENWTYTYELG